MVSIDRGNKAPIDKQDKDGRIMNVIKVSVNKFDGNGIIRAASFPVNLADAGDVRRIGSEVEAQKLAAIDFAYDVLGKMSMNEHLHLFDRGFAKNYKGHVVYVWAKDIEPGKPKIQ